MGRGYVQADGTLGEEPVFRTPEEWGTVKVIGEGIIPERTYLVQVVRGTPEEPVTGEAIEATTWKWSYVAEVTKASSIAGLESLLRGSKCSNTVWFPLVHVA